MARKYKKIEIGDIFCELTVINYSDKRDKWYGKYYICKCKCGKQLIVNGRNLNNKNTKSCGCIKGRASIKQNIYDLKSNIEYGVGYASNTNKPFYFDKEDYNKIKDYCWYETKNGYMVNKRNNKTIYMHKIVMDMFDNNIIIDHINRKKMTIEKKIYESAMQEKIQ